jgi:hypothetical protein
MIIGFRYTPLLVALLTISAVWAEATQNTSVKNASKLDLPALNAIDKNNDGLISRDEGFSNEDVSRYLDKLDTDLDGNLDKTELAKLESVVKREESLKTDHPDDVQQYKNGKSISPNEQIEKNRREVKD